MSYDKTKAIYVYKNILFFFLFLGSGGGCGVRKSGYHLYLFLFFVKKVDIKFGWCEWFSPFN